LRRQRQAFSKRRPARYTDMNTRTRAGAARGGISPADLIWRKVTQSILVIFTTNGGRRRQTVQRFIAFKSSIMKSAITKRSIKLHGKKTSVSLEDEFWEGLLAIAKAKATTPTALLRVVNADRNTRNMSSAIRVFVLNHYRRSSEEHSPDRIGRYPVETPVNSAIAGN
jgi:predicted DNA-binding ribbon-helix-helix protein